MKKVVLTLLVAVLALQISAQESTFNKGDKVLNLGIGLGNALYGSGYTSKMIPLSASFEVGVADGIADKGTIGVGGYVGYSGAKWEYLGWGYKFTNFIIGARGTFHYPLAEKLDTYGGLLLGYNSVSTKDIGNVDPLYNFSWEDSGLVYSLFLGGRYYFTDNVAGFAELGSGISYLTIGAAFKF
jgi:hypothetical protein